MQWIGRRPATMYFYLLLLLNSALSESKVPIIPHKLNLSVESLFYETEFAEHYGRKTIAFLFKLNDRILEEDLPDVRVNYANLSVDLLSGLPLSCANLQEMSHNLSLIQSNLMGPIWNNIFQNTDEENRKEACEPFSLSLCEGAAFCDLIPITEEIIPLPYTCHSIRDDNILQIDIGPVVEHWFRKGGTFYEKVKIRSFLFSLVIDAVLMESGIINNTKEHPINLIQKDGLVVNMEYVIDRRCYTEETMDDSYQDYHDEEKIIKVCKFRDHCPEKECGISCDFEEACEWKWDEGDPDTRTTGFQLTTGKNVEQIRMTKADPVFDFSGPHYDSQNDTEGHFLLLAFTETVNKSAVYHLKSPWFSQSDKKAMLHMHNMNDGTFKFLMHTQNHTTWVPLSKLGNDKNTWERLKSNIGKTTQPFHISLEVIPSSKIPSHIAVDNIRLVNCFPQPLLPKTACSQTEFRCRNDLCIDRSRVCDLAKDCLYGEDEENCDKMPANTTCNFEKGWCGWINVSEKNIRWERTNKPSQSKLTGPSTGDHTFNHIRNVSGYYLFVNMNANYSQILDKTMLRSSTFAPPPAYHQNASSIYYKSCQLRFFYHMFGPHVGSLHVDVIEANPRFPKSTRLTTIVRDQGNIWHRESNPLPKLDHLYYIEFVVTRGPRFAGDIALDDISLSPECVGQRVPQSELRGYSYEAELNKRLAENRTVVLSVDMENVTKYVFTTCNNSGRMGPSPEQCEAAYRNTPLNSTVTVLTEPGREGVQIWTVPESKHYTFVAKGASGGRGAVPNRMSSSGSMVKVTLFLKKGELVYILVGQEGSSVCEQRNTTLPQKLREACKENLSHAAIGRIIRAPKGKDAITELNRMSNLLGGGGGGGGATFIYKMEGTTPVILLIAAGGGGLAYNALPNILPYGGGMNVSLDARAGASLPHGAGGGGGWTGEIIPKNVEVVGSLSEISRILGTQRGPAKENSTMWISAGSSFLDGGGIGGLPCIDSEKWGTEGGFGGGGGGCTAGGGGGGFVGGSAHSGLSANGEGGLSYYTKHGLNPSTDPGGNDGPGSVVVIPSIEGCGCEFRCILLDEYRFHAACVCPDSKILNKDGYSCSVPEKEIPLPLPYLIIFILIGVVIFACVGLLCIFLYNRYQKRKAVLLRRKVLGGPELQLSRLRAASGPGGVLTEYNPNYEFGGETYSVADLKEIPRENLRLIKALGQGAFGEVYQGFYKHRAGDTVEMPVAVKTLPELSSNQAEMDFLMEALIMSKFNHPNIVHFIGVCFDKHPRFIILELLAGGDLKTFLRESRPKPEKGSPLAMKDLLHCAIEVAKGCKYLEENHFIHRDIAARNCLLTSKGPGRVVKIADFGMARDIYRADYYKKGGKAMLPVKWMPPEAFLDGIFTSKTDVWSYGVLLWEVFSLGYMPYPGRGNQDVMQLVTNGGRLEPPSNCPPPVYGIMTQCWHPIPEERPTFSTLLERVGYCIQDPEVVNAPLPVFQRPPSSERDTTIMRPLNPDDQSCLRIVHKSNTGSLSTVPPSPNSSTADYLVPLAPYSFSSSSNRMNNGTDSIVTSPTSPSPIPESESTQTLLEDEDEEGTIPAGAPSTNIYNSTKLQNQSEKKPNGLTLNPATLDKSSSRTPVPYANVGVKKPGTGKIDEEIRC